MDMNSVITACSKIRRSKGLTTATTVEIGLVFCLIVKPRPKTLKSETQKPKTKGPWATLKSYGPPTPPPRNF